MDNLDVNKSNNQQISHIFIANGEEDCKLSVINGNVFNEISTLKYFEFERTDLRVVDTYAFRR